MGPRRLRPSSPKDEIELLRALGMALTAASGQLLPLDDVQEAFVARSRMLVTAEFVEALLGRDSTARDEAELLIWLCRERGRRGQQAPGRALPGHPRRLRCASRRSCAPAPTRRRTGWRCWRRCRSPPPAPAWSPADLAPVQAKLGEVGGLIEADVKLTAVDRPGQRAGAAPPRTCCCAWPRARPRRSARPPTAPAPRRMKLLRSDAARAELAAAPGQLAQVRDMLQLAGMAA